MTLLQLPPIKVWVSHTAVMKDGGPILLGFVRYFFLKSEANPSKRPPLTAGELQGTFQLLPVLLDMTQLYLQPWGQTGLDGSKYRCVVDRKGAVLTYTAREDSIIFL